MPWRRIAVGGAIGLVLLGGAAAIAIPAIQRGKEEGARRDRAERQAFLRHERARLRRDQRPRFGRTGVRPAGAIVAALAAAITRDARGRVRAGTIAGPILRTDCERGLQGKLDPRTGRAIYRCTAVQGEPRGSRGERLIKGYPFVASVDLRHGRFYWCKVNILPGEHDTRNLAHVRPSRLCAGPLRPVL